MLSLLPLAAVAHSKAATPERYPNKPIRLIVPFSPGGTNNRLARMVATHLSQALGENVIADNRMGADGIIGTELAVKSRPDRYTLLLLSSAYAMNPVVRKPPYDTPKALDFFAKLGASYRILSAGPAMPVKSVRELPAATKAKPVALVLVGLRRLYTLCLGAVHDDIQA